jgi:sec-independent protein translocase protein TatA
MGSLGPFEVIIIFLVILLIFGAKRIPEIARGLGKGIREFKSATSEISKELTVDDRPQVQQPRQSTPVSYTPPAQQPAQTPAAPPQQAPQPDNAGGTPAQ